jgi:protein O-mannosyl-transferase
LSDSANRFAAGARRVGLAVLAVWLVAAAVYLPKLANNFTFDDRVFIVTDPHLRSFEAALGEFGRDQAGLYRPLRSLALATLVTGFGVENPVPFQLTGTVLHATLAALVVAIVWLLLGDLLVALVAGLAFALHPVHADRVANVTGSFDLLGLMFAYGAWAMALWYGRRGGAALLAAAGALLALGCLGSEEALMVWPLALGSAFLFGERGARFRRLAVVFSMVAVVYLVARFSVLGAVGRTVDYAAGSLGATLLTMPVVVARYVGLLLFPVRLSPAYGPEIFQTVTPMVILSFAALTALAAVAIIDLWRRPAVALALGWFFVGLAPFSNLLPGDTLMAERYLYAGLGGFALLCGLLARQLAVRPKAALALGVALAVFYGVATVGRVSLWGQPRRLWAEAAANEPNSFLANLNAGYFALQADRFGESEGFARRAHALKPDRAEPLMQLGESATRQDQLNVGLEYFGRAVQADREFCPAYSALAQALVLAGQPARAAEAAGAAIQCDPGETQAHYVLAYLLVITNQCAVAEPHLAMILDMQPRPQEYGPALELQRRCQGKQ